jgi:hypothetical protein
MPPLLEKETTALGSGITGGGDRDLSGGASASNLAGEAMALMAAVETILISSRGNPHIRSII